jgi:ankyrin repeat protein
MSQNETDLLNELIDAVVQDRQKARQMLKRHPSLLNARRGLGETAIHFLAVEGCTEGVQFLAVAGADVNAKNEFGDTPLIDAALLGKAEVVRTLLSFGADPNAKSTTMDNALHCAIKSGSSVVVEALLLAGGNPSYRTELGETVFSALPKSNIQQRQAILEVFKKYSIERMKE